jgi:hypothetical protein
LAIFFVYLFIFKTDVLMLLTGTTHMPQPLKQEGGTTHDHATITTTQTGADFFGWKCLLMLLA